MPQTADRDKDHIDRDGYRKNVGLIVCNDHRQVLWARRVRHDGWQFPQGGINPHESPIDAAYRELREEIGLESRHVRLLGSTSGWLRYEVTYTVRLNRNSNGRAPRFRGQKQRWFLFALTSSDAQVRLDVSDTPEFDEWRWVEYWYPLRQIVEFKKAVYRKALTELEPLVQQVGRK